MTMDYGFETDNDSLRAKINDMLARIASLEDKEGDSAYGNGSRKVKRVLHDYMRFNQVSKA